MTLTTNAAGVAKSKNLPFGTYKESGKALVAGKKEVIAETEFTPETPKQSVTPKTPQSSIVTPTTPGSKVIKTDRPKTGDDMPVALFITLIAGAGAALIGIGVAKKKGLL